MIATAACADGRTALVACQSRPCLDEHGRYAGALAMVPDVTALREAGETVRSRSEGLDAA